MNRSIRRNEGSMAKFIPPNPLDLRADKSLGIIYVAYGDLAVKGCAVSMISAKRQHPGIQTAVVSDIELPGADFSIIQPSLDIGAREYKTNIYQYSPFDYTLFLDADTLVVGSLQAGFSALQQGWDVVMALDYRQTLSHIDHIPAVDVKTAIDLVGTGEYPHYNAGMIFWRKCSEVERMYRLWHEEWARFRYRDQAALVRAIYRSEVKLWTVAWQWNTHREEKAKHVFHNHHSVDRQWQGNRQNGGM